MLNNKNVIDGKILAMVDPEHLAPLLAEAAMTNACTRRRLQFELSVLKGEDIPAAVHEWITEFGEQTSFLDTEQIGELAEELNAMRIAIAAHVSRAAPTVAPDLMWRFFTLAGTIFERTSEEGWEISDVFDRACSDLIKLSIDTSVEPVQFATKVGAAIISNHYGEYRALIRQFHPLSHGHPLTSPS